VTGSGLRWSENGATNNCIVHWDYIDGQWLCFFTPPAEDKADWERQQKQQEETASSSSNWLNNPLFCWSIWLAAMGAGVATHQVASLPPPDNSTSNQSPSP
jgi:hypothetical protein